MEQIKAMKLAEDKLWKSVTTHDNLNSIHEAYGVMVDQIDQLLLATRKYKDGFSEDDLNNLRDKYAEIAAIAMRSIMDLT